jgi:hypothetical protein
VASPPTIAGRRDSGISRAASTMRSKSAHDSSVERRTFARLWLSLTEIT